MILRSVRKNKIKTGFIITLFFIFITLFIYFLSRIFFDNIYIAAAIGLSVSIISAFVSYYNSDKMILSLNPREQFVITHRFGLNGAEKKTLEEIGEIEGVTRERIRQIEAKAMRKLRTLLIRYKEYLVN